MYYIWSIFYPMRTDHIQQFGNDVEIISKKDVKKINDNPLSQTKEPTMIGKTTKKDIADYLCNNLSMRLNTTRFDFKISRNPNSEKPLVYLKGKKPSTSHAPNLDSYSKTALQKLMLKVVSNAQTQLLKFHKMDNENYKIIRDLEKNED